MPQGDGTGPKGAGPLTGRRLGYCAGFNTPGFANAAGRGFGRGLRRRLAFTQQVQEPIVLTQDEEKQILEENLKNMQQEIESIQSRLKELKSK